MKPLTLVAVLAILGSQLTYADRLEVQVHGLTCAFCVDSLERKLKAITWVRDVRVSMKDKTVLLELTEGHWHEGVLRQAILDSGFTPVKIEVRSHDQGIQE